MTTLRPDREQVLRYLGHKGQEMSKALEDRLEGCIDLVCQAAAPRVCTGSFAIEKTEQGIQVSDTTLVLTGRDIADLLKNSRRCFLMAATLGPEVDRLCRYQSARSMADAVMVDAAATALIECVCDKAQAELADSLPKGQGLTMRYSCGYGDLPLSLQPMFVRVLDAPRRIGLSCLPSLLLTPQKSVTAVMGISQTETAAKQADCQTCRFASSCVLRKAGKHCGNTTSA